MGSLAGKIWFLQSYCQCFRSWLFYWPAINNHMTLAKRINLFVPQFPSFVNKCYHYLDSCCFENWMLLNTKCLERCLVDNKLYINTAIIELFLRSDLIQPATFSFYIIAFCFTPIKDKRLAAHDPCLKQIIWISRSLWSRFSLFIFSFWLLTSW